MKVPAVLTPRIAATVALVLLLPSLLAASPRREDPAPRSDPPPFDPAPLNIAETGPGAPAASALMNGAAATDWAQRIDQKWGPSPWSVPAMLAMLDTFWSRIDQSFACFQGLDVDWTALRTAARAEIQAGVSRGRFVAIMNHLALALRESHTTAVYPPVSSTAIQPGVPLFVVGGWGDNRHFRAGLTPLPDSSLLVYKVASPHPLGLKPGDIVLGYGGVPWKRLYPELLAAQLPLTGFWWGSSSSSWTHSMLMSAGLNWHLFDTIDIVKYGTRDTLHLSLAPLGGPATALDCTEQLPVPGVPMPNYLGAQDPVSWGIVSGTQIGYVYVRAWDGDAGTQFYTAVQSLLTLYQTTGLIFDFRTNYGGNMFLAYPALDLLFGEDVSTIGFAERCGSDHLAMCPSPGGPRSAYVIHGAAPADYDRPIAVLVGPGAVSSGDQVAHLFRFHPHARFFGKSTSTAFNAPTSIPIAGWFSRFAEADAYRVSAPTDYLTHDELKVDEPVWLTPDDVAHGVDTVVQAAIRWINNRPPVCSAARATLAGSAPDHELAPVAIDGVYDPDGDSFSVLATAVTQDEPVNGTGDGDTCPDATVVDGVARVRWERAGSGNGRTYFVSFTARDRYGAEGRGTVQVCVPHDRGRGAAGCVGDDRRYDSMSCAGTQPGRADRAAPAYELRASSDARVPAELQYELSRDGWVDLGVYDVAGRRVRTLVSGGQTAGSHRLQWSARGLRPGMYFAVLRVDQQTRARAVMVAR